MPPQIFHDIAEFSPAPDAYIIIMPLTIADHRYADAADASYVVILLRFRLCYQPALRHADMLAFAEPCCCCQLLRRFHDMRHAMLILLLRLIDDFRDAFFRHFHADIFSIYAMLSLAPRYCCLLLMMPLIFSAATGSCHARCHMPCCYAITLMPL